MCVCVFLYRWMTWMKWQLFIVATLQLLNITVDMYFFKSVFINVKHLQSGKPNASNCNFGA